MLSVDFFCRNQDQSDQGLAPRSHETPNAKSLIIRWRIETETSTSNEKDGSLTDFFAATMVAPRGEVAAARPARFLRGGGGSFSRVTAKWT
jgi:hypothetical protein